MTNELKTTVRLKKQESIDLQRIAFDLTRKAILNGKQKVHNEPDLVHFLIENYLENIDIDENGNLILKK